MGSSWIHVYSECTERTVMLPCCNKVLWLCNRYKMLTSPLLPIWPHARKKTPTSKGCLSSYLANFVCLLLFSAPPLAQLLIGAILVPTLLQNVSFCNKSTARQHLPAHLAWLIAVWLFDIQLIHYSCPLLSLIEKAKNTVVPSSSSSLGQSRPTAGKA